MFKIQHLKVNPEKVCMFLNVGAVKFSGDVRRWKAGHVTSALHMEGSKRLNYLRKWDLELPNQSHFLWGAVAAADWTMKLGLKTTTVFPLNVTLLNFMKIQLSFRSLFWKMFIHSYIYENTSVLGSSYFIIQLYSNQFFRVNEHLVNTLKFFNISSTVLIRIVF